jgi:hypothetical protein
MLFQKAIPYFVGYGFGISTVSDGAAIGTGKPSKQSPECQQKNKNKFFHHVLG